MGAGPRYWLWDTRTRRHVLARLENINLIHRYWNKLTKTHVLCQPRCVIFKICACFAHLLPSYLGVVDRPVLDDATKLYVFFRRFLLLSPLGAHGRVPSTSAVGTVGMFPLLRSPRSTDAGYGVYPARSSSLTSLCPQPTPHPTVFTMTASPHLDKPSDGGVVLPAIPPAAHYASPALEGVPHLSASSSSTSSPADSKHDLSVEKGGEPWDGYLDDSLPEKSHGRSLRNLRFQVLSLYRRLFGVVFVVNLAVFIHACVKGADALYLGKVAIANIFVAILMRQDYVVNAFFTVACAAPRS